MNKKIRLQKYLAGCGIASRRKSEELIESGHVRVNGKTATIGDSVDPKHDIILYKGKRISVKGTNKIYIMLNKPRGYITTMQDEQGRKSVADLVKDVPARVFPVGRLDRESEGLLLLTNDGDFANSILHPSKHIPKTYRLTVKGKVSEEQLTEMTAGMMIDGKKTLPADVRTVLSEPERSVLELTIYEGRNRQIRKMCESLGLEAARLKRIKIGQVKLGMLQTGKWRELNEAELKHLTSARKQDSAKVVL